MRFDVHPEKPWMQKIHPSACEYVNDILQSIREYSVKSMIDASFIGLCKLPYPSPSLTSSPLCARHKSQLLLSAQDHSFITPWVCNMLSSMGLLDWQTTPQTLFPDSLWLTVLTQVPLTSFEARSRLKLASNVQFVFGSSYKSVSQRNHCISSPPMLLTGPVLDLYRSERQEKQVLASSLWGLGLVHHTVVSKKIRWPIQFGRLFCFFVAVQVPTVLR